MGEEPHRAHNDRAGMPDPRPPGTWPDRVVGRGELRRRLRLRGGMQTQDFCPQGEAAQAKLKVSFGLAPPPKLVSRSSTWPDC